MKGVSMTEIVDSLDGNRTRKYEIDALRRLDTAKGGLAAGAIGVPFTVRGMDCLTGA